MTLEDLMYAMNVTETTFHSNYLTLHFRFEGYRKDADLESYFPINIPSRQWRSQLKNSM
jgi:hypothetical protein